jgi:hypothetical protein
MLCKFEAAPNGRAMYIHRSGKKDYPVRSSLAKPGEVWLCNFTPDGIETLAKAEPRVWSFHDDWRCEPVLGQVHQVPYLEGIWAGKEKELEKLGILPDPAKAAAANAPFNQALAQINKLKRLPFAEQVKLLGPPRKIRDYGGWTPVWDNFKGDGLNLWELDGSGLLKWQDDVQCNDASYVSVSFTLFGTEHGADVVAADIDKLPTSVAVKARNLLRKRDADLKSLQAYYAMLLSQGFPTQFFDRQRAWQSGPLKFDVREYTTNVWAEGGPSPDERRSSTGEWVPQWNCTTTVWPVSAGPKTDTKVWMATYAFRLHNIEHPNLEAVRATVLAEKPPEVYYWNELNPALWSPQEIEAHNHDCALIRDMFVQWHRGHTPGPPPPPGTLKAAVAAAVAPPTPKAVLTPKAALQPATAKQPEQKKPLNLSSSGGFGVLADAFARRKK